VKNIDGGVPSYAVRIGASDGDGAVVDRRGEWGRSAEQSGRYATAAAETVAKPMGLTGKFMGTLAVIGVGLAAVNLLTWRGVFWAAWPLLAFAVVAALRWVRANSKIDPVIGTLAIAGMALVAINLLSWRGVFWAVWPLLAIAVAAGIRWVMRQRNSVRR
ncbi:MAG: adenylate/guanylate cyclase domain-containing protein, partial [Ensifer adhaerens]